MKNIIALTGLFMVIFLTGCVKIENPVVTFVGQKVSSISLEKVTLNLEFNVFNPNNAGVEGAELTYTVFIKGIDCFQGKNIKISLPANQNTAISLPVEVAYSKLFASSMALIQSVMAGDKDLPYEVQGSVMVPFVGFPINIPVSQKGTLPLPPAPKLF